MATPAIQERTIPNTAITTATAAEVSESRTQHQETPDVFQVAEDAPQVSTGFFSNIGRWAQKYGEFKLTTGYWNLFRI